MKAVVAKKSFDAFELRLHGGCQEIIRCFGIETTVEHIRHFYNLFLGYAPYGLSHIHCKGIVHCDLKPENILVFPDVVSSHLMLSHLIPPRSLSGCRELPTVGPTSGIRADG
ncbi:hypothetical protein Ahy_Scaffold6g107838 [Arachis hypogaea]|uniref:Protein kinase domain-containing protein n=1 Tax=Arachis hypogaea TaxID=3818 RepID=A0A444WNQ5_ARAHY|nr:hypothetical protein Ahy_Scaffold6g107838 [Arachis hypogaea]